MRNAFANRFAILGHPIVAAALSVLIVLSFGAWAASKVSLGNGLSSQIERVMVEKRMIVAPPAPPQPELRANVGSESGVPVASNVSQAPALRVPQAQIARTGKVSLFVTDVNAAVRRLSGVARRNAGDVFSLDVSNEDGTSSASAEMQIRVPANSFESAMDEVAKIGKVRERSASAEDLTGDLTDSSARLRNLRQTEADIRKIMDRSGNVSQVMDAESQLSQVREQIETLEASLASMRGRITYSTVSIDVQAELPNQPVEPTAKSQLAAAWQRAVHALTELGIGVAAVLLWLLVFAPVALIAGACAFAFITVLTRMHERRKNREGTNYGV